MISGQPLYLRPNVQVEPLVDQWYAWSHLIPPATAARNISERHLKIMDSYIAAPQIHAVAVKDQRCSVVLLLIMRGTGWRTSNA